MAETALKQAMSILFDMEKNNYLMTKAIIELDQETRTEFVPPEELDGPRCPHEPIIHQINVKRCFNEGIPVGGILGVIAGVPVSYLAKDIINEIWTQMELGEFGVFLFPIVWLFCGLIGWLIATICCLMSEKKKKEKSIKDHNKYLDEKKKYDAELSAHNTKYRKQVSIARREYEKRNDALRLLKQQMIEKLKSSQFKLVEFYNTVGIDVKFRNIVPIAYMNEFLNLGISTKLEGADGLYYLTMKELRMDQMQHKLDSIASKLDTIIDHQHSLYAELTAMNRNSERLISASINQTDALLRQNALIGKQNAIAEEIEKNSAIAAYNSERVAKEAEYQSYLQRYNRW